MPGNPLAEDGNDVDPDRYNEVEARQPSFYCQWEPCWDGCCFTWDGTEKFYNAVPWLEYLIDHFLKPEAYAAATNLPCFEGFTFDHRADGIIDAVSAYDGWYVALAEALEVPLLTLDRKLADAPGPRCSFVVP